MPKRLCLVCVLVLTGTAGCSPVDRAAIDIAQAPASASPFPAFERDTGVRKAFEQHTSSNGYRCHRRMQDKDRYVCRGPRDLHLTFDQRLDGTGYVAGFTWVRSHGRSEEEFRRVVVAFQQALAATGAAVEVRMGETTD